MIWRHVERTLSIFCLRSPTSVMSSSSRSGLDCRSSNLWWGATMGRSAGMAKIFRKLQSSKKSNAISICDSSNVWKATKPCSMSWWLSHSFPAGVFARSSAHRSRKISIPSTVSVTALFATLITSSSSSWGEKPRSSGSKTEGTVGGGWGLMVVGMWVQSCEQDQQT